MTTHASTRSADGRRFDDVRAGVNPGRHERGRRDSRRYDPGRHEPGRGNRGRRGILGLVASALALLAGVAAAEELLVGTMPDGSGSEIAFRLEAGNRRAIEGGRILLGEAGYEISRVSRLGLIGARRFVGGSDGQEPYAEFLVLSSSFSAQTATGKPWLAAREWHGCEERPYNTYLAFYRVEGEAAVKALGPIPYPKLAEELPRSQESRVFCFMARPPD